jgi:hypothetical protein
MVDGDECGAVSEMSTSKANNGRKLALVPLCPPQIPQDLIWALPKPPRFETGD